MGAWLRDSQAPVLLNPAILPSRGLALEDVLFIESSCLAQDFHALCEEGAFDFIVVEGRCTPALIKQALIWIHQGCPYTPTAEPSYFRRHAPQHPAPESEAFIVPETAPPTAPEKARDTLPDAAPRSARDTKKPSSAEDALRRLVLAADALEGREPKRLCVFLS